MTSQFIEAKYVIIGGGISGVTCAEYLSHSDPGSSIILVAATDVIKAPVTTRKVTEYIDEIDVAATSSAEFEHQFPNVSVMIGFVEQVDAEDHTVTTVSGTRVKYNKLCVCTGAEPDLISKDNPFVIGIRDTDTVTDLQNRLSKASRVLVVGNGGIALELVYEIVGCEIVWCIKNDFIGNTFLDKGASEFLIPSLHDNVAEEGASSDRKIDQLVFRRKKYQADREHLSKDHSSTASGTALGPDWSVNRNLTGTNADQLKRNVHIEYECECVSVLTPDAIKSHRKLVTRTADEDEKKEWNVYIELTNGKVFGADFIVSATGAMPFLSFNIKSSTSMALSEDGALKVDDNMRTSAMDVYAAGDCCKACWDIAEHWFQMRLWTQAWQMGAFAGKCMAAHYQGENLPLDFCFELFTHATTFFGFKLCLLGLFNAQGLGTDCEFLLRCTKGAEYIKLVLRNGRVQGAVLIGETDMEETIENLILNQMDVSRFGESLLDPDIDIDDYFD